MASLLHLQKGVKQTLCGGRITHGQEKFLTRHRNTAADNRYQRLLQLVCVFQSSSDKNLISRTMGKRVSGDFKDY